MIHNLKLENAAKKEDGIRWKTRLATHWTLARTDFKHRVYVNSIIVNVLRKTEKSLQP